MTNEELKGMIEVQSRIIEKQADYINQLTFKLQQKQEIIDEAFILLDKGVAIAEETRVYELVA